MASLDELQDVFEVGRNLAPQAVAYSVLIMSGASILTVIAFNFLRPKNKIIYEPRVKYHEDNKSPPTMSDSFFGWLPPLLHTKEPELLDKIGLDAVTFLRFLRLMRWLFTGISVLTCGALIPINVLYNFDKVNPKKRDALSILTIRDVKGDRLYAHVAVTYLVTIFALVLIYIFWRDMVKLRDQWFRSPEYIQAFYARTLSITGVPKKYQSDEGLNSIFAGLKMPYPTTSVHISRKVGKLPELIEYHNQTVREFEMVLVKYMKGGRIARHRPTVRVGGCCGLGGQRRDAIDFYTNKLKRTEAAVEQLRAGVNSRKPEKYGFASLAAVPYAHTAAKQLARKHPKGTTITLAPNPKDIIWENMDRSEGELFHRRILGWVWLVLLCLLSLVPLFIVAVLANIDGVTAAGLFPFLTEWSTKSSTTFAIVFGIGPPLVSALFTFFLPRVMRWLSQYMGATTHARLDRAVIARYFAFLVISQLFIFTLIGVAFNSISQIVIAIGRKSSATQILKQFNKLPSTIHRTYINQASFWLKFLPFRGFLVLFDLAQLLNLLWISLKTRVFGRTPRDIREWTQPPEFEYAIYYANLLYLGAIGLLFAPLAPLVSLAAGVVFWMSSWVYKYQLMYVFVTKVETGGRLWNVVINRLLVCLLFMQAIMVLTIGLQYRFRSLQWIATTPPIFFVLVFKLFINRQFDQRFRYFTPSSEQDYKVHSGKHDVQGHRLESRFGHPALYADLFTPMVHSKMMPLLAQVYQGKISDEKKQTKLNEYGGQETSARVLEGVTIAAVDQNDLEFDPALYRRDRGDLDRAPSMMWSRMSTPMMSSSIASPRSSTYQYDPNLHPGTPTTLAMPAAQPGYFEQRPTSMHQPMYSHTRQHSFPGHPQPQIAHPQSWYSEQTAYFTPGEGALSHATQPSPSHMSIGHSRVPSGATHPQTAYYGGSPHTAGPPFS